MSDFTLRAACLDDGPAIAPLLGELGYPTAPAEVEARLARLLSSSTDDVLVAVRAPADVVGLLCLHRFAGIHDSHDVALIMALVIADRARRSGAGRQLVERAAAIAQERGCTRLLVTTHLRRAGAHAFYERLGFEFTGRRYVMPLD